MALVFGLLLFKLIQSLPSSRQEPTKLGNTYNDIFIKTRINRKRNMAGESANMDIYY